MRNLITAWARVALVVLLSACGGRDANLNGTAPTAFATTAESVSINVAPAIIVVQPVADPFCPGVPPFNAPFSLLIRENSGVSIFVTEIRLRFVDALGAPMPQITLPAPVLTRQFGSLLIQARGARTFPMSFGLGCGTDRRGSVIINVDTRDEHGRTHSGEMRVAVH